MQCRNKETISSSLLEHKLARVEPSIQSEDCSALTQTSEVISELGTLVTPRFGTEPDTQSEQSDSESPIALSQN